jgi:hypothetical protein
MSCKIRRAWATGAFDQRKQGVRWDVWTREEREYLEKYAGSVEIGVLAERISAIHGVPRTAEAIRIKGVRWGISLWAQGLSLRDVELLFHLDHRSVVRCWVEPGLLKARRWSGRGPNAGWWFESSDVEAFIRAYPWAYDWTLMRKGHPLTRIAEVVNRLDPWLHHADLCAYVGISDSNLDRWRRRGLVPYQKRPKDGGWWVMVRAREFPAIRERIRAAQQKALEVSHAKFTARRRGLPYTGEPLPW